MQKNPVVSNVNKMLIGALLWTLFYLRLFFDEIRWNETFLGETLPNLYNPYMLYGIQILFFGVLNMNLYHYTVGKRHAVLDYPRFFKVLIWVALIVFIAQTVSLYVNIPFHFGLIGYFFGQGEYALYSRELPLMLYGLYMLASMMFLLYVVGVCIYLYQVIKMKLTLSFAYFFRYLVIFGLYGMTLGYTPTGFDMLHLVLMGLYILVALIVYVKTKYSLKALVLAIILLMIL